MNTSDTATKPHHVEVIWTGKTKGYGCTVNTELNYQIGDTVFSRFWGLAEALKVAKRQAELSNLTAIRIYSKEGVLLKTTTREWV